MRRPLAVGVVLTLVLISCGGGDEQATDAASTIIPLQTTITPTTTIAATTTIAPTTTIAATTTIAPTTTIAATTTTTVIAAQPLEDVVGVTASDRGWRVEPGIYSAAIGDADVTLDIAQPVTYLESPGRLDFGPETMGEYRPTWISFNQYAGAIPPEMAGVHFPHDPIVPDSTIALPEELGPYLESIPHMVVEEAGSVEGNGFTARAWDVSVDPSQGDTFSCFLGSCVSVLVSESGGVFVFGSDASARVWQFDGDGVGLYGYLQSHPEVFDDTVAVAEMLIAGLRFDSP